MTTNRKVGTTNYCFACGQVKDKRLFVIHIPTMQTYCRDLEMCGNPKQNILHVQRVYSASPEYQDYCITKTDYESIDEGAKRFYTPNAYESLMKLIGKALRVRLNTRQTLYLAKFSQENKTSSTTETMSKMIDRLMELEPMNEIRLEKTELVD